MGNSRARAVYEALLSDNFRRPQTDSGLESFIRSKYEQKKYIAREWIPPPPITKVDWDKEIEEEIENQKRKKKPSSTSTIPEPVKSAPSPINVAIPGPLPKPHSPKNSRLEAKKAATASSNSMDLLGLDTASTGVTTASPAPASNVKAATTIGDGFDFFANVAPTLATIATPLPSNGTTKSNPNVSSLKQEEDDFFNQKTIDNGIADKGKMTKDSILALYGSAPAFTQPQAQPFNANFQQYPGVPQEQFFTYGQQPGAPLFKPVHQQQPQQNFVAAQPPMAFNNGNFGNFNANFGTMQTQQINKLNEENIKKIESLNFNNFK